VDPVLDLEKGGARKESREVARGAWDEDMVLSPVGAFVGVDCWRCVRRVDKAKGLTVVVLGSVIGDVDFVCGVERGFGVLGVVVVVL
jgi:hypothetical protein